MSTIKKVVLVGAGGNLGPTILNALKSQFTVTILTRKSSKSTFPSEFKTITVSDDYPEAEVVDAFKGQDAVVSTVAGAAGKVQLSLIDAAVKAGVKRFIPAEYGSDTTNPKVAERLFVFQEKVEAVEYLKKQESSGLTWSAIVTGPFLDWGIKVGFLGFDIQNQKATIYDDGATKFTGTTLANIGKATAQTLANAQETENKYVFVSTATTTQNEVLAAFERSTGKKWDVEKKELQPIIDDAKARLAKHDYSAIGPLIIGSVFTKGLGNDYAKNYDLFNSTFGLPQESIQTVVDELVKA